MIKLIDWDGDSPFFAGDNFCRTVEELIDLVDRDCEASQSPREYLEGFTYYASKEQKPPVFSMYEFITDHLCEDECLPSKRVEEIDRHVNEWIERVVGPRWCSISTRLRPESILGEIDWSQWESS